jgi:hypothetical protein
MAMKNKISSLLFMGAFALVCLSCSKKDDPKPDVRADAMGTYNYKSEFFLLEDGGLTSLGNDFKGTGSAVAALTEKGFQMSEGGAVQFKATDITEATTGFTFTIESQTITADGQSIVIKGYEGASLATSGSSVTKCQGYYAKADKKMEAYFQYEQTTGSETYNIVVQLTATKAN